MPKREAALKAGLMRVLRDELRGFVCLRHEDRFTAGIPDISVTGAGRTTWWECKHGTPDFDSSGLQELEMMRLAAAGYARYIVWWEGRSGIGQRTLVVTPKEVHERKSWLLVPEEVTSGFNHKWLVEHIRQVHDNRGRV